MNHNFYHIDDALLVKYLLGESAPDEAKAVEAWIMANDANRKHFQDFKLIWDESKAAEAVSSLDEEAQWQKFKSRITPPVKPAPVRKVWTYRWLKLAAMVIFIAGAAVMVERIFNVNEGRTLAIHSLDRVITDTLPDKTVITLNKNSTLDYPEKFRGNTRTVSLKGEAFFSVVPDKSKPFIIHVNDVTVKVVGTSFNVKSIDGNTEVIVETGIVEVIRKKEEIDLHPHEKILVKKNDDILRKEKEDGSLYNYYRTKEFVCDNTPLWQLVQVLNESYDVNIVIERKELRSLPLTTTFHNESLDQILEIIRQTFNISITRSGTEIILK